MSFIAFIFVFVFLLIVPGMILFFKIKGWGSIANPYSIIPESFIFSFALGIFPGLYVLFYHKNLRVFIILYVLLLFLMLLLSWKEIKNNISTFVKDRIICKSKISGWYISITILAIVIMVVGTLLFRFGMSSDSWLTCANVKHFVISKKIYTQNPIFVESNFIGPRIFYNVYGLFCAALSYISFVGVFKLVFLYIKIPLIILTILSMYSLAMEIFHNRKIGSLSVLILAIFCLLSVYTQEGLGYILFDRINQDKTIMAFIFIPIALKYMYRYVRQGARKIFVCFFVSALGASILHPQGVIFIGFAWLSFLLSKLIFSNCELEIRRFTILIIPVIILASFPFYQKVKLHKLPRELSKVSYSIKELRDLYSFRLPDGAMPCILKPGGQTLPRVRYIKTLNKGFYIAHPNLINHPFYIITMIIAVYWLFDKKKRRKEEYQFLIGLTLIPPLVIFNPITAPIFGYFTTSFKMWRMIWLIPVPLVMAKFIGTKTKPEFFNNSSNIYAILIISVIAVLSLGYEYGVRGKKVYNGLKYRLFINSGLIGKSGYHERWVNIDNVIRHINDGGKTEWLLAPRHINTRIPAYYGNIGILSFRGYPQTYAFLYQKYNKTNIEDRVNVIRRYGGGELSLPEFEEAIIRYKIDTIVIDKKYSDKYLHESVKLGFNKTRENNMYIIVKQKLKKKL